MNEATIRKNGEIREITIDEINKEYYNDNSEFLFCANRNCNAKIGYSEGPERRFFHTMPPHKNGNEITEQHITNCPYEIFRKKSNSSGVGGDGTTPVGITLEQRARALETGYRKALDPEYGKKKNSSKSKKNVVTKKDPDDKDEVKGKPTTRIVKTDDEGKKTRAKSLFQRDINEVGDSDYNQIRTVHGIMSSYAIGDNFKSITFYTHKGIKARVFFGEFFKVNYESQYNQIDYYFEYFDRAKAKGEDVIVVCIGDITKDDYDISIVVSDYHDISLNHKKHYEIFNIINGLI